jgi:peptidoglycan/LPS O-acetylase OafA/YrhL
MPGGFVGVDIFFVVSGFLITSILYGDCLQGDFSLARFYQRRISRIFPAFLATALVTLIAAFLFYLPQDLSSCGANLTAAACSVANLKYMLQGNYFTISPDAQPFLHYWSLSVEEQFYLLFPLAILLLHRWARPFLTLILSLVLVASITASIALTHSHPVWAFYLLPTRAWELLAGALLAVISTAVIQRRDIRTWNVLAWVGLAMIAASLFAIHEGSKFPGWIALLPVIGTVLIIGPNSGSDNGVEKFLARPTMVYIGKISYSLYLWHWPVYSFIDYVCYQASEWQRMPLKVAVSFGMAIACHNLIENPARKHFNSPERRRLTFAAITALLIIFSVVGIQTRKSNYLAATEDTVANGGIVIGAERTAGSIALIGDSNGSMYGTALRQLADNLRYRLAVLSVPAGDPLPSNNRSNDKLWHSSLAAVTNLKPTIVVLACDWIGKLSVDKNRLPLAINALSYHTQHIVILTKPPILPANASRAEIRNGAKPPFYEDIEISKKRREINQFVKSLQSNKVKVIDLEPVFKLPDGGVRYKDDKGRLLYQDSGHLSHYGGMLVIAAACPWLTAPTAQANTTEQNQNIWHFAAKTQVH